MENRVGSNSDIEMQKMIIKVPQQHMPPAPGACKLQLKTKNKGKITIRIGEKRERKKGKTTANIMQPKEHSDMLSQEIMKVDLTDYKEIFKCPSTV